MRINIDVEQQDALSYDVLIDSAEGLMTVAAKYVDVDVHMRLRIPFRRTRATKRTSHLGKACRR